MVPEIEARPMVIDEFLPLVGMEFTVDCEPEPVGLKLIEASPLRENGLSSRPPFILVFHSQPSVFLVPGGYIFHRKGLSPSLIHIGDMLAPPGSQPGYYYQAIFN